MKKGKVKFMIATSNGPREWQGMIVKVDGAEDFIFIAHHPWEDGQCRLINPYWIVSEYSTGQQVSEQTSAIQDAIESAEHRIKMHPEFQEIVAQRPILNPEPCSPKT